MVVEYGRYIMHLGITNLQDYSVGMDLRLSKEVEKKADNADTDDSEIIKNQRTLLKDYVRKQKSTICECNKLSQNNNAISNINVGMSMQNKIYEQLEIEQGEMKVILEFPQDSRDEDSIKEEVKSILSKILHEHLEKIS